MNSENTNIDNKTKPQKTALVVIMGRPSAGKSTFLNMSLIHI